MCSPPVQVPLDFTPAPIQKQYQGKVWSSISMGSPLRWQHCGTAGLPRGSECSLPSIQPNKTAPTTTQSDFWLPKCSCTWIFCGWRIESGVCGIYRKNHSVAQSGCGTLHPQFWGEEEFAEWKGGSDLFCTQNKYPVRWGQQIPRVFINIFVLVNYKGKLLTNYSRKFSVHLMSVWHSAVWIFSRLKSHTLFRLFTNVDKMLVWKFLLRSLKNTVSRQFLERLWLIFLKACVL